MVIARKNHTATVLSNGCVLIVGGRDSSQALSSAEVFNPTTGKFISLGEMSTPRVGHTATLLKNGKVLITGGRDANDALLDSAEIYEPTSCETGTFHTVQPMILTRCGHTATVLTNGWVLIVGGETHEQTAEVFKPDEEKFYDIYGDAPKVPRVWHTATLFTDSTVLLAGSGPISGVATNAEFFTPNFSSIALFRSSSTFVKTPKKMYAPRKGHSVIPTWDGNLLFFNGDSGRAIERYRTDSGTFTFAANLWATNSAPTNTTATLLGTEGVLFLATDRVELVTVSIGSQNSTNTNVSDLTIPNVSLLKRAAHTAIEVPTNKLILVAGGVDSSNNLVSAGTLYNPVKLTALPDDSNHPLNGETVYITGSGFFSGDTVTLNFYTPGTPPESHGVLYATVDSSGNISKQWQENQNCTTPINCTATDPYGCSATCSFTVHVTETNRPTMTCPDNIVTNAGTDCTRAVTFAPQVSDECPGVTYICSPASGTYFQKGTNTVVCIATDTSSNTSTCQFTVTVIDTTSPTISCPADVVMNTCAGQSNVVSYTNPTYSDNCVEGQFPILVCNPLSGATFPHGTNTVTCIATDNSSNTTTCQFTVTVMDIQSPTIACSADKTTNITSGCSAAVRYDSPSASDNCISGLTTTCSPTNGATFAVGHNTVTCTAVDAENNSGACTFDVWVRRNTGPAFTTNPLPNVVSTADPQYSCSGRYVSYATPVATSTCPGVVTVVCSNLTLRIAASNGSWYSVGTNLVNCTASDVSGNVTTNGNFKVILDPRRVPPNLYVFGTVYDSNTTYGITTNVSGTCSAIVTYAYLQGCTNSDCWIDLPSNLPSDKWIAVPNCSAISIMTNFCNPPSGTRFPVGITNVICRAIDNLSNTNTWTNRVSVLEAVLPTFTSVPKNTNVFVYANQCSRSNIVYSPALAASDNCSMLTNYCVPRTGLNRFFVGASNVTCYAVDKSLNTNTTNFVITVIDNLRPTLTACPANIVTNEDGTCQRVVTFNTPIASDNCSGAASSCSPPSGWSFPTGSNTVICTAVDAAGNTTNCTFKVIVYSKQVPTVTNLESNASSTNIAYPPATALILTTNVSSTCSAVVTYVTYPAPNCGASMKTNFCKPPTGTRFPIGASNVTCSAVDSYSNTNTLTFTLKVNRDPLEEQIKIFSAPTNTNVVVDVGKCTKTNVVYTPVLNSSNLSCFATSGIRTQYCDPPTGKNTFSVGITPVTCYAYSKSPDNQPAITNFTVTVNAKLTNVISGQCVLQACDQTVIYTQPTVANNCADVTVSCVPPPGGIFTNSSSLVPTAFGGNGLTGQVTVVAVTCTALYASSPVGTTGLTLNVQRRLVPMWIAPFANNTNSCRVVQTTPQLDNFFTVGNVLTNRVKLYDLSGADVTASVSNKVGVKILFQFLNQDSSTTATFVSNIVALAQTGGNGTSGTAVKTAGTMVYTNDLGGYFKFHAMTTNEWSSGTTGNTRFFSAVVTVTNTTVCGIITNGIGDAKFESQ
jgi:hypothetical protein